jgi:hypothetical protein
MWGEMQDLPPELPRLTYEAWCQLLPGQPHPRWGSLPTRIRRAWEGVVTFVALTERAAAERRAWQTGRGDAD